MSSDKTRKGNILLRNKALRLLEDVGSTQNISNLKAVIDKYKFTYHEFTPSSENELLLGAVDHNDKKIYVNRDMAANERNFILAHEIGHIVLHPEENHLDFKVANQKPNIKESEANVFAYELLMPLPKFIRIYQEYAGNIFIIAEKFFVPERYVAKKITFLKKQIEDKKIFNFID